MPKYQTLDQIVKWKGERIPPYTEVTVVKKDCEIWDRLVRNRVAIKVAPKVGATDPEP